MDASIRLGKIFGIPLGINYSWLIVFALAIFLMTARFGELYPQWSLVSRCAVAVVTTIFFFGSVLVHELSHSLVALAKGIPVRGITLFIFGGVSELDHEAQRPSTELLITVVGPATNLALAVILGVSWYLSRDFSAYLSATLFTLFAVNLSLGIFNLLPGFPLDGGRVLRAGIWGATGNYWLATRLSLWAGQGLGVLLVAGGFLWAFLGNLEALWLALVGGFLFYVAARSLREETAREKLSSLRVAEALSREWTALPGNLSVQSPEVLLALSHSNFAGILVDGGIPGVVTGRRLQETLPALLESATLADVMTPLTNFPALDADLPVLEALERIRAENLSVVALVRQGIPVGMVTQTNLLELIYSRSRRRQPKG